MTVNDLLADEEVERAWKREGITHPVLDLFDTHAQALQRIAHGYRSFDNLSSMQKYEKEQLPFFADAVEQAGDFALGSLEIIAIWSKVTEMDLPMRYQLAGILGFTYVTAPLGSKREGAARYFLRTGNYREDLHAKEHEKEVKTRLDLLRSALIEIDFYCIGMRCTTRELIDDMRSPESKHLFEEADKNQRRNPLIHQFGRLRENFENGLIRVYQGMRVNI